MRLKIGYLYFTFVSLILHGCDSCIENSSCYGRTFFNPRQVTYDPVFQNAINYHRMNRVDCNTDWKYFFSVNGFVQKSVQNNISNYFNIDNKCTLQVRENGTGDIDSLWFKVISSNNSFYSSQLKMCPEKLAIGALIAFDVNLNWLCNNLRLDFFTSVYNERHKVNLTDKLLSQNKGTVKGYTTVSDSFASSELLYGKICPKTLTKSGIDDIQIKLMKFFKYCSGSQSIYFLLGVPTSSGSKSIYLFEPLVGSKHFNLGLGTTFNKQVLERYGSRLELLGELKYRYALQATEKRSFDLCANSQWSRYLLFVTQETKSTATFPAINALTLDAQVTPGSNLDLWLAINYQKNNFDLEFGYDFWFRQKEKIKLKCSSSFEEIYGIADLPGIALGDAQTASTAKISQSVEPGNNQIQSDPSFVFVTSDDINLNSAAQPRSITNKYYASLAYNFCYCDCDLQGVMSVSYENSKDKKALNQVAIWFGINGLY